MAERAAPPDIPHTRERERPGEGTSRGSESASRSTAIEGRISLQRRQSFCPFADPQKTQCPMAPAVVESGTAGVTTSCHTRAMAEPWPPLDGEFASWADWAGPMNRAAVLPAGRALVEWAFEQVRNFYTDEWLARQFQRRTVPVMTLANWPLSSPRAIVQLVERAARIALLDNRVREQLTEGPNGIRRTDGMEGFDHLDVVLETIGLALRDGWTAEAEVPTANGRKPDLRITRGTMSYTIEVTIRGADANWRKMDRQQSMLGRLVSSIERRRGVEIKVKFERNLSEEELAEFPAILDQAAGSCSETGAEIPFDVDYAHGAVYSAGERPDPVSQEGPTLGGDVWPRIAERLVEKAVRTAGAGHTWIRIDEFTGLLVLTPAYHWSIEGQLTALAQNASLALQGHPHVRGVILTTGAHPDWNPQSPELRTQNRLTGAVAQERRLPGGRRRRSFVIPVNAGPGLVLPDHLRLNPANWYRDEMGWIDWALARLGKPALTPLVPGEQGRRIQGLR